MELTVIQWGTSGITNRIRDDSHPEEKYIKTYSNLNSSILFDYEPSYFKSSFEDATFDYPTAQRLLSMNQDGTPTDESTSLLNF